MRRVIVSILALFLLGGQTPVMPGFAPGAFDNTAAYASSSAPSYTGPLNVVSSGVISCWSLRACSGALASSGATTTPVMDVHGATSGTSCTIYLLGNGTGGLDFTTSGIGGVGHQCASGATTFCSSTNTTCTVSKLYDQSNTTSCSGTVACHLVQATVASQPTLILPGASNGCPTVSLPCLSFTVSTSLAASTTTSPTINQPYSWSLVSIRTSAFTTQHNPLVDNAQVQYTATANTVGIYLGGVGPVTATASDSTWHSLLFVANNATDNYITVDQTVNSLGTVTSGTNPMSGTPTLGAFTGKAVEAVMWSSAFSTTNQQAVNANASAYW